LINNVASLFSWRLGGLTLSTQPDLNQGPLPVGNYDLTYSFRDFLGRDHSAGFKLKVLSPDAFKRQIVAPIAARSVLM
jgi:hypothetical protein